MITVIGLGEVGIETFKELCKSRQDIFGVDIKEDLIEKLSSEGYKVGKEIPLSETYILAVYLTQQVFDVLGKISYENNPLIVLESTVMPGTYKKIMDWKEEKGYDFDIVLFPHRFNPNDPEHHVFNLDRAIGGETLAIRRAVDFYKNFMKEEFIHPTTPEIAELTKPIENAYRFLEISFAQELKMLCDKEGLDFEELRKIANTKWNIDIKEARDGIGGKCLPKDVDLINKYFAENTFFEAAIDMDNKYKSYVKNCSQRKPLPVQ